MASQAEIMSKKISEYSNNPLHDPAVLAEMLRMLDYANTIDPDVTKKARAILNRS